MKDKQSNGKKELEHSRKKILLINTGGTIGMVGEPLHPSQDWKEITKEHPSLWHYPVDYYQLEHLVDSSDMHPKIWLDLANILEEKYEDYDGFVVLHGTDTMSYTASALSFLLKNLGKPVILTGSQVPLAKPRSDALQNLITAIQIASDYPIPEVCILFRDTLLRGNRSKKMDATNYFGFSSPNYSVLGEIGAEIKIFWDKILASPKKAFYVEKTLCPDILVLELFPGMNLKFFQILIREDSFKGIILKTFGNGNAPTSQEFLSFLKTLQEKEIPIVDVTQCIRGSVELGKYASSQALLELGVISAKDMTIEASIGKLMYLLGKYNSYQKILEEFPKNIAGEISLASVLHG